MFYTTYKKLRIWILICTECYSLCISYAAKHNNASLMWGSPSKLSHKVVILMVSSIYSKSWKLRFSFFFASSSKIQTVQLVFCIKPQRLPRCPKNSRFQQQHIQVRLNFHETTAFQTKLIELYVLNNYRSYHSQSKSLPFFPQNSTVLLSQSF